tara:strand:+ start:2329 stop:3543 length:1215 start_codon:yes stop_codon:yes gene_type:complete
MTKMDAIERFFAGDDDALAEIKPFKPKPAPIKGAGLAAMAAGQEHKPLTFSVADLEGIEPAERKWIVHGFIPDRQVTLLYGDGGTGKSLIALQLTVSVALRSKRALQSWLGRPVIEGSALYIGAEDEQDEMHRRLADMVAHEQCTWADLERLRICSLAGEDALLADLGHGGKKLQETALYKRLDAEIGRYSDTKVVVLDTLADMFGGEEIDRKQVRAFVNMLKRLAIKHDCAVVMLAHPSKSGMTSGRGDSGSTAWNGSVRARLYFEFDADNNGNIDDPDARKLTAMKMNYGRTGEKIAVRYDSGVFKPEAAASGLDKTAADAKAERVFLTLLDDFTKQGRNVKSSKASGYAPKVFTDSGQAEGLKKIELHAAMERLFAKGQIVERLGGSGPPSKQTMRIVRAC